jgi:hypothetical protein
MATIKGRWEKITEIPGGHKFFRLRECEYKAPELCPVAIADDSGRTPDKTDDGIIWMDFTRAISCDKDGRFSIPVRDMEHNKMSTPASFAEVVFVSDYFKMPIKNAGKMYAVVPTEFSELSH